MTRSRSLIFAILVYVTLDLSVAAMPGAFVFDAEDSVESVQMARARPVADVAKPLEPARDATVVTVSVAARSRAHHPAPRPIAVRRVDHPAVRAADLPSASEDPH